MPSRPKEETDNKQGAGKVLVARIRKIIKPSTGRSTDTQENLGKGSTSTDVVGKFIDLANVLKSVSPVIPVPWIGPAADAVVKILEVVQVSSAFYIVRFLVFIQICSISASRKQPTGSKSSVRNRRRLHQCYQQDQYARSKS